MSKEIDAAVEVMDRAMDDIAELRQQLQASRAECDIFMASNASMTTELLALRTYPCIICDSGRNYPCVCAGAKP